MMGSIIPESLDKTNILNDDRIAVRKNVVFKLINLIDVIIPIRSEPKRDTLRFPGSMQLK
jgi:hypothetical protein